MCKQCVSKAITHSKIVFVRNSMRDRIVFIQYFDGAIAILDCIENDGKD
jgi:hypothetical protein